MQINDPIDPQWAKWGYSTLILIQMGQSCFLFFTNAHQYAHKLTANLLARYTFAPAGEILEVRRTVKERR